MFGKSNAKKVDLELFTIYDSKTKSYRQPTMAVNHHDLIRQIVNMFRDPEQQAKNQLYTNAEDFSIFRIGNYDMSTGTIEPLNCEHIANLHDLRALVQPESKTADQTWPHGQGPSA